MRPPLRPSGLKADQLRALDPLHRIGILARRATREHGGGVLSVKGESEASSVVRQHRELRISMIGRRVNARLASAPKLLALAASI